MKMRIIGAILLLIISIPILYIGNFSFLVACVLLGAFALKELMELKLHHKPIPNFIFILSVIDLSFLLFSLSIPLLNFKMVSSCVAFTFLSLFLPCLFYKEENYSAHEAMYLFGSILFLSFAFSSFVFLRRKNIWLFVYFIFISIFTDTFALFVGKMIGKHKCSPTISPNKTWEGSIGGSLIGVLISSVFYFFAIGNISILKIILLSASLSIVGQFGDLVFSKIKRENKIKDFSHLIPGHGGVLDRFDSLIFIVITYILLYTIL